MIYTVTLNPSLDYIVNVEDFKLGRVNRTTKELIYPGGKGINVSLVLKNLSIESTALGFVAGFTGKEIERLLQTWGCLSEFITIDKGLSRINLKLRSNEESEINGQGPEIDETAMKHLYEQLQVLKAGDLLVLAGSIPNTMSSFVYEEIMKQLQGRGIKIIVDATGDLLVNVLQYEPFLIKPNNHELEEIFHVTLSDIEEIIMYGKKLKEKGARNVLISMAGDGAILIAEDGTTYRSHAPKGRVINSVGAGDSMVAGFLAGFLEHESYEEAFKMGIATGSASAFSERLATRQEVNELMKTMK
ncbi:MAG: 1-phosphofructokinase [Velocimicrobium sp.]